MKHKKAIVVVCIILGFIASVFICHLHDMDRYTIAWEDNFDNIDRNIWVNEIGYVRNSEIQEYTDSSENVFCKDGILHLKAIKDANGKWTSGSITSEKGFSFGYGLIEVKAKSTIAEGCLPAVWSMADKTCFWLGDCEYISHPYYGEIDWIEYYSGKNYVGRCYYMDELIQGLTGLQSEKTNILFDEDWHIIGLERTENEIRFYYDRKLVGKLQRSDLQEELYTPHYILMDVALGVGGDKVDESLQEAELQIDWIRYYLPEGKNEADQPTEFQLNCGDSFELKPGQIRFLFPEWEGVFLENYHIDWDCSDETIAACSGGTVEAFSNGVVTITASTRTGLTKTVTLTVSDSAENDIMDINLYSETTKVDYLSSIGITALIEPNYASENVIWESSNEEIATVREGIVTAVNPNGGDVTVFCKSEKGDVFGDISLYCRPKTIDNVTTDGVIAKYTKLGWESEIWFSDLQDGASLKITGDRSTGFAFHPSLGYNQDQIKKTEDSVHIISNDMFDAGGEFTVVARVLYPAGEEITSGYIVEIVNSNGSDAESIKLVSDCLCIKGPLEKFHIFEKEYDIGLDKSQERSINAVIVKETNGCVSLYINGKKICRTFMTCINNYEDPFLVKVGSKTIPGGMYQAFLVYNRALSEDEVGTLFDALKLMYD